MPETTKGPFKQIFGSLDAKRDRWEVALVGHDLSTAVVHGRDGQSFEQVFETAQRALGIARKVAA